ncbi:flagellum-associated coiled-coil domain-containing protein 1-like [Styela clava]
MRPKTAHSDFNSGGVHLQSDVLNKNNISRPGSGSFVTRTRVFRSNETAYHTWLRRSNEFSPVYNLKKHPRDYKSVQTFNLRSGCQVTRSASQLQVRIDPDEFFDPKIPKPLEPQISAKEMEVLIESLQEQVRYLSVYLEEEKLHHAGTKKRAKLDIEQTMLEMEKSKQVELQRILNNQAEIIQDLKTEHSQQLEELEEDLKGQYQRLEKEYKMLQASFKNYRSKISEEMEGKWNDRKKEFEWDKQRAVDNAVDNTRRAMEERFNKERISIRKEYKELMQQMVDDQRKEMEDFMRKMSDGKSSIEELKAKADKAEQLEYDLKDVKDQLLAAKREIKLLTHDLNETKANLSVYEQKFEEKVGEVEDKYRKRIDDLVNEVSDFRVLLIKKAETMYSERAAADELQKKWTNFAKGKLEKLFQKTEKAAEIEKSRNDSSSPIGDGRKKANNNPISKVFLEDVGGGGDGIIVKNLNNKTENKTTEMNIIPEPESREITPPRKRSGKSFGLPPRKNTKENTTDSKTDNISLTIATRDKIKHRCPLTTVSLLDTANLPYVDDTAANDMPLQNTSRPHSPDVIF